MRLTLYLFLGILLAGLNACTDQCKETRTFRQFTPVTLTIAQVRNGIQAEQPRTLVNPGKIYTKDGFLLINEIKEGIHVIDNRNPSSPKMVAFLRIPGNGDMAIRNNVLYADSYMDLVAFDISDVQNIRELNRVKDVFPNGQFDGGFWSINAQQAIINDQKVEYVTQTVQTNCENTLTNGGCPNCMFWDMRGGVVQNFNSVQSGANAPAPSTNGTGGSMARFTLYDNYLYTVSQSDMQLFDIKTPSDPKPGNKINLGWGIETIFPYKDKLFIGAQSGMHIYDNSNPEKPVRMSTFEHARVCDPVVVHEDKAYVTLRSGSPCQGFTNQLEVVDVSNLYNPRLLKTYPMKNPHGLGIDFPNLFICEGAYGLKTFNAADAMKIDQLEHLDGFHAFDVIPLGKSLLLIGMDGFYQYDYSNPKKLRLLSKIPVQRPYPAS
ncbi:LVIVD repeat-containing protein [Larkinella sp. VNQ87]|uniref:LVIVD repeat-containing protein n=1 Tax=Larkinella sp. VNQ87 TaxID=3400921 RepID=UPI003BFEF319